MVVTARELHEQGLGDCHGWDAAVNLITPVHRLRAPVRKAVMQVLDRSWTSGVLQLIDPAFNPVEPSLRQLNHLHVARWSVVTRLPKVEGSKPERGCYTLVLFTSYFDAGWRRYLGTFIETSADRLSWLWGDIPEWRKPSDGAREFENFVVKQQVPHGHLFDAFPGITCNEIRDAVRLKDELQSRHLATNPEESLGRKTAQRSALKRDRALLRRVQHNLGSMNPLRYEKSYETMGAIREVERDPTPHGFTCLVPYSHDHSAKLNEELLKLSIGKDSPFAQLPGTRFARLAMIGNEHFVERSVPPLANGYLLLSAEIDGYVDDWLSSLASVEELGDLWRLCHGFTGMAALPRLWKHCRIRESLEFIDLPGVSVNEIHEALCAASRGIEKRLGPPLFN